MWWLFKNKNLNCLFASAIKSKRAAALVANFFLTPSRKRQRRIIAVSSVCFVVWSITPFLHIFFLLLSRATRLKLPSSFSLIDSRFTVHTQSQQQEKKNYEINLITSLAIFSTQQTHSETFLAQRANCSSTFLFSCFREISCLIGSRTVDKAIAFRREKGIHFRKLN